MTYLRKIPFPKYFICLLLFISGLYFFFFVQIFFGLTFTIIGLNLISTEGSQIDFDRMMYRNIRSVFGISFGKWKELPAFDYISVFKTTENKRISVATASTVMSNEIFLINLFYETSKCITFYKTEEQSDAFEKASDFSRFLNLRVLDSTGPQGVWVSV